MRVVITGGTGLIGHALSASLLADQHEVTVLSRNPQRNTGRVPTGAKLVQWDAATATGWEQEADGADAIVNLAGEGIADGRWTEARKRRIRESRIDAGKAVVQAVQSANNKPKVVIQSSGVDYYGSQGDQILTEEHGPGNGFLAAVCFDWEASTAAVEAEGVRRAIIRSGIVLSTEGGAFPKIMLPFRLFAGGPIGSGKQWWPWIHIQDEVNAIRFLIENAQTSGVFNLAAPEPLQNRDFAKRLGSVMGRPSFLPAPTPALQIALGEMSKVLLESHRVIPQALTSAGFTFTYPDATAAFRNLLNR